MSEKPVLTDLSVIDQAMLFLLYTFDYEVVCVKELYHKTKEDMWMIKPKDSNITGWILGAVEFKHILNTVLSCMEIRNKIIDRFELGRYMLSSVQEPYDSLNIDKINLFLLGRYGNYSVLDYFEIKETDEEIRIEKRMSDSHYCIERRAVDTIHLSEWYGQNLEVLTDNVLIHGEMKTQTKIHIWPKTHGRDGKLITKEKA